MPDPDVLEKSIEGEEGKEIGGEAKPSFVEDPEVQSYITSQVDEAKDSMREEIMQDLGKKFTGKDEEKPLIDPDWKPSEKGGWNEVAGKLQSVLMPRFFDALRGVSEQDKQQLQYINQQFDTQLDQLKKEGKTIDANVEKELFRIGVRYKVTDLRDCYDIYEKVQAAKTARGVKGKKAGLVGSGEAVGDGGKGERPKSYREISGKSLDDIITEELDD